MVQKENGLLNASKVKTALLQETPNFTEKNFGYKRFLDLLTAIPDIELQKTGSVSFIGLKSPAQPN